eukprot:GGOE01019283.1.p2 GENE.GGOE01019283.1~~GGOE01019283.1.p2  ORF type:complete len:128 (-),score=43.14 GGOE01019283.1:352-735(-)
MWTQDGYLRCDLCHVYIFMDQFPDHRRKCGTLEPKVSPDLKATVQQQIDGGVEQRERRMQLAQRAAQRSGYNTRQRLEQESEERLAKAHSRTPGSEAPPKGKAEDDEEDPLLAMLDPARFAKKEGRA